MVGTPASPCIYCNSSGGDDGDDILYSSTSRITRSVCRSGHKPHLLRSGQSSSVKKSRSSTHRKLKSVSSSFEVSKSYDKWSHTDQLTPKQQLSTSLHNITTSSTRSTRTILDDEYYDISPKTGYTYAESGAYSPNSLERVVFPPNMSRARIHSRQSLSSSVVSEPSYTYRASSYSSKDRESSPASNTRLKRAGRASSEQPSLKRNGNLRRRTVVANQLEVIEDEDVAMSDRGSAMTGSMASMNNLRQSSSQMESYIDETDYQKKVVHGYGTDDVDNLDGYMSDTDSIVIRTTQSRSSSYTATASASSSIASTLLSSISSTVVQSKAFMSLSTFFSWWYWLITKWTAMDVWFLQKGANRSRCCGCLPLFLIFLLPFLLLGLYEMFKRTVTLPLAEHRANVIPNVINKHDSYANYKFAGLTEDQIEAKVLVIIAREISAYSRKESDKQSQTLVKQIDRESQVENDLKKFQLKLGVLENRIQDLDVKHQQFTTNINSASSHSSSGYSNQILAVQDQIKRLQSDILRLELSQQGVTQQLKTCCKTDAELALFIQDHVSKALGALFSSDIGSGELGGGGSARNSPNVNLGSWLESHFVSRGDLTALAASITQDILQKTEKSHHHESNTVYVTSASNMTLSEQHVRLIVQDALNVFMADKTGMVDYALESSGLYLVPGISGLNSGSIVSIRCSETYNSRTAMIEVLGFPLWYSHNSPRTAIQPDVNPGQCWAFKGTLGFLVVKLSARIRPTAFTLEHIPKVISPSGNINSAPRQFSVIGLMSEYDSNGKPLGNYTYNDDGPAIQTFPVLESNVDFYPLVELQIHNNHGTDEYTCIYRFRVHGKTKKW